MIAAYQGHIKVMRFLLARGANARQTTGSNETALHLAAATGQYEACQMLITMYPELMGYTDVHGAVPMHNAADGGYADIVRLFFEAGQSTSLRGPGGATALQLARERGHEQVVRMIEDVFLGLAEGQKTHAIEKVEESHQLDYRADDLDASWSDDSRAIEAFNMGKKESPRKHKEFREGLNNESAKASEDRSKNMSTFLRTDLKLDSIPDWIESDDLSEVKDRVQQNPKDREKLDQHIYQKIEEMYEQYGSRMNETADEYHRQHEACNKAVTEEDCMALLDEALAEWSAVLGVIEK